ncbi:WecB/TagA/CpsF family glycosyltransferase [Lyngbya confervoides]|uniref:WecB/TagA/CpsF family glycosyltransferase n=1 Tax=Lyngbya confervoides BDU141951 TaxID=1574623 RepID=A0ABD4T8W2_9CYAN|nr:WecB/TagA/CpsF family glycosyltransferase [Lyngbya confervoides]MCM1984889.1 WecB/TagA/CpsF family glycosyltransferase [Lyngbya confervoides BDU141951]
MNSLVYFNMKALSISVVGVPITAMPFDWQISRICEWAQTSASRVICLANTHMLVEATQNRQLMNIITNADLVAPDGMPLVWMLRLLGARHQNRVAGLDVFESIFQRSSECNLGIYLVGSHPAILAKMQEKLADEYPAAPVVGIEPLPFSSSIECDQNLIDRINASKAGIVFVSLGCPKQEKWMALHKGKINAVMIGVGAVFPVYAGIHKRAPQFLRTLGLEWLFRLAQEPLRLWKRYAYTIPIFLYRATLQLLHTSLSAPGEIQDQKSH